MLRYICLCIVLLLFTACGLNSTPSAPQAEDHTPIVGQAKEGTKEVTKEVKSTATEVLPTETSATNPTIPSPAEASAPSPTIPSPTEVSTPPTSVTEVVVPTEVVVATEVIATNVVKTTEVALTPATEEGQEVSVESLSIGLEQVVDGLSLPVAVVNAMDGSNRLFVVEKAGTIRIIEEGKRKDEPFLDISDSVSSGSEQGLLGLAFEPQRPERFYVNYTDRNGATVITRYQIGSNPDTADLASAEIILTIPQPAGNHNGGHLLFGPDGYLWIGTGDGGAANDRFLNGQNKESLLGAMLRLDVSGDNGYTIPADNPFVNGGGAAEIWAIGLRNPWRYSFDSVTNDLWVADVGQNQWEEVHKVGSDVAGLNYGWPILEGSHCFADTTCVVEGLQQPITEYNHTLGCSITGGNVYRGNTYPQMQGKYFFSDFCSGRIWGIDASLERLTEPTLLLESNLRVSSFGEDEAGELYLTSYENGTLYRVVGE